MVGPDNKRFSWTVDGNRRDNQSARGRECVTFFGALIFRSKRNGTAPRFRRVPFYFWGELIIVPKICMLQTVKYLSSSCRSCLFEMSLGIKIVRRYGRDIYGSYAVHEANFLGIKCIREDYQRPLDCAIGAGMSGGTLDIANGKIQFQRYNKFLHCSQAIL